MSFFAVFVSLCVFQNVNGHARLIDPPSRASMWRYGFNTPPDYNDNEGFCGGRERLIQNGGKCGICGDPYDSARHHEVGGIYATGEIVKNYKAGQKISVKVDVTANHKGYFEFRLCASRDERKEVTQECLNKNLLLVENGSGTKYFVDSTNGVKEIVLRLPSTIVCPHCVLQWRYRSGNNWGTDPDGKSCIGCGPQEEYYACSDISIGGVGRPIQPTRFPATTRKQARTTVRAPSTTRRVIQPNQKPSICHAIGKNRGTDMDGWCAENCARGNCPKSFCSCEVSVPLPVPNSGQCRSHGSFKSTSNDIWCKTNCNLGNCPKSHCKCY